jgi:hypothetical protein
VESSHRVEILRQYVTCPDSKGDQIADCFVGVSQLRTSGLRTSGRCEVESGRLWVSRLRPFAKQHHFSCLSASYISGRRPPIRSNSY